MTAHVSNFLPDTPTVAGALAYSRGTEFIFHAVNRLDKGTTGLMAIAKSGHVHDLLRKALHSDRFHREYRAVCVGLPHPAEGVIDLPIGRDQASAIKRMYRLPDSDALFDIGWEDYLGRDGVCAVEWSERVGDALPEDTVWVTIARRPESNDWRTITVEGVDIF